MSGDVCLAEEPHADCRGIAGWTRLAGAGGIAGSGPGMKKRRRAERPGAAKSVAGGVYSMRMSMSPVEVVISHLPPAVLSGIRT